MSKSMKIYLPLHHGSVLCGLPSQHVALIVLLLGLLHSAWIIVSCLHDPLPPPRPNPLTLFPTTCPLEHLFSHRWLSICLFPGPYRGGSCPRAFACARPSAVTFLLWMSTWLTLSFLHESRRRKPSLTMAPSRCVPLTPFPLSSGPFSPADTLPFCLFFNHLPPATGCQLYEDRDFVVLGIAPPVPRIVPGM